MALALAVPGAAMAANAHIREELGAATAPAAQLEASGTVEVTGGGAIHRYRQTVDGVPVVGAEAVLVDSPAGPPSLVNDTTRGALHAAGEASLTSERAVALAQDHIGSTQGRGAPRTRLVIDPGRGGTLAWEVLLPSARPLGDFLVLVDARTGRVLLARDLLRRGTCPNPASGCAKVFIPNAVVANDGYGRLHDDHDRNTPRLNRLREEVTLRRLNSGQDCLRGPWVDARKGRKEKKICRSTRDWRDVKRRQNAFEALMTYYHLDETQAYIQSLDITDQENPPDQTLNGNRPQRAVANGFPQDNSFYSPINDEIKYGHGGVDDGEDADVIVHEYGHAVQDAAVKHFGQEFQGGAMGEGFSDYLAGVMSIRTVADPEWNACVAEWDAVSYDPRPSCLRRLDNPRDRFEIEDQCGHEIHCVGQAWSGALWDLRAVLGEDPAGHAIMDRVVLTSHFQLTADADFAAGANALLCADALLYPLDPPDPDPCRGQHWDQIRTEMQIRGFLP